MKGLLKKTFMMLLIVAMAITSMPLSGISVRAASNIKLKKKSASIVIGETAKIQVKNATGAKITYKSSKPKVAAVSKKGIVTGKSAGSSKIRVLVKKSGKNTKLYYKVKVNRPAVLGEYFSMNVGDKQKITIENQPKKGTVTWSSSNNGVASVGKYGTITAKGEGKVNIVATIKAYGKTYKSFYTVRVNKKINRTSATSSSNTYTVTFNTNGGTEVSKQVVEKGNKIKKPSDPTKKGYVFKGWYQDKELTVEYDFDKSVNENLTLHAKWAEDSTSSSGGGSYSGGSGGYSPVSTPTQSRSTTYTVNFESNGGNQIISQTIIAGGKVIEPASPVRNGYIFEGWYTDSNLSTEYNFDTAVTKSFTLYAKWTLERNTNEIYATYVLNDGSDGAYDRQVLQKGGKTTRPAVDPSRASYIFTGWYTEPGCINLFDFNADLTGDITLYAGWGSPDGNTDGVYAASSGGGTEASITDITLNEAKNLVSVTVNTNEANVLVVDFLDETNFLDKSKEYNPSTANDTVYETVSAMTPEYCELTTVSIPINTTAVSDKKYLVRATLYNGANVEQCEPYYCIKYTSAYSEFEKIKSTDEEYSDKTVLNFDDDTSNNFGVLQPDVKQVASLEGKNIVEYRPATNNDENVYYIITNPDETVANLQVNDKIYIKAENAEYLFKVGAINNTGGTVEITESTDVTLDEFYSTLKVSMDVGKANEVQGKNESNKHQIMVDIIDVDVNDKKTFGSSIKEDLSQHVSIEGEAKGTLSYKLKMVYDAKIFRDDYFSCSFTTETSAEIGIQVKADLDNDDKVKEELEIGKQDIPTPVPGLTVQFKEGIPLEWSMEGGASFNVKLHMESGFEYDTFSDMHKVDKKDYSVNISLEGKAELKFGPKVSVGVAFLNSVVNADIEAQGGLKVTASNDTTIGEITNAESKHLCRLCISGEAKIFFDVKAKLKFQITKKLEATPIDITLIGIEMDIKVPGVTNTGSKFYISLINDADSPYHGSPQFGFGECKNKSYRTVIKVKDTSGNYVTDTDIIIKKANGDTVASGKSEFATYLYEGVYTATAEVNGVSASKQIIVDENAQTVELVAGSIEGFMQGTVLDSSTKQAISDVDVIFKQGNIVVTSCKTASDGTYKAYLPDGTYEIEASKQGYITFVIKETLADGAGRYLETINLIPGDSNARGGFSGKITDAITGNPVPGVKLELRSGWNNTDSGDRIETLTTNDRGEFKYATNKIAQTIYGLKSGNYTLAASKEGYIAFGFNIVVMPGEDTPNQNSSIVPIRESDKYVIKLRWISEPSDLDSHVNAVTVDGQRDHIYFSNMRGITGNLDRDDTNYEGPETITITSFDKMKNGFTYSVNDYTNEGKQNFSVLSASGAYVELYCDGKLYKTYYVPTGRKGTVWNVFSVDKNGTVSDLNTFEEGLESADVGKAFVITGNAS